VLTRWVLAVTACLAALLVGADAAWAQGPDAAMAGRVPVLAELFTSEGCSSCPPADRILEMLATEQPVDGVYVVGLSEHVTYWDHQGWRDPFGSRALTFRQNAYGTHFKLESVFTPQLVIDGAAQMVGSDTAQLQRALAEAARAPKAALTIAATLSDKGLVVSASGPGIQADNAELLWAVTEDNLVVEVKRGENAKRTLRHTGVVRTLVTRKLEPAKPAAGTSAVIELPTEWKRENLRLVAFVQSTKTRRVLSVAWTRLPGATAMP
jgi:hypothetical protein